MKNYLFLVLITFVFINVGSTQNLEYVSIKSINRYLHLADSAIIFEDKTSTLNFRAVLQKPESEFKQTKSDIPFMDFTTSTYWMKLKLKHDTAETESYYIELARPLTNIINLYIFNEENELIQVFNAGDNLPFSARPHKNKKFVFPYKFSPNAKLTLLVEANSDGEILKLPVKVWNVQAFSQFNANENFLFGFYYGFISLVIILFTFFGIALRQRIYFFFVSYVILMGLFQFALDGLAYKLLWPNNPYLASHSILFLAALSMLALLSYAKQFLEFYKLSKWFNLIYRIFFGLVVLCLITSLTTGTLYEMTYPILNGVCFVCTTLFFIGIYLRYRSGVKTGIEVTLAFLFLWFGAIFFILSNVNIIRSEFLATNSLKIASGIEVLFLSISLAARYRTTQQEKIEAQKKANKVLTEINELKEQQTENLEAQVLERTKEIENQNVILSEKNKEIINSIVYAKRLQDALLPPNKLLEACFPESSIFFLPKDIVSGDFYWMDASKNYVYFAVADCTGHGVPGAMVSVVGFNALNKCINELELTEPGLILDKLTDLVEHTFDKSEKSVSDGMDLALCRWDYKNELKFSGAFNPLYLFKNDKLIEMKGDKQPIGKYIKRAPFTTHTIKVEKGDSIILFSDGYADQFGGEKGKKLKYSGFQNILNECLHLPTSEFKSHLEKFFHQWRNEEEQIDDVCVLKIKF